VIFCVDLHRFSLFNTVCYETKYPLVVHWIGPDVSKRVTTTSSSSAYRVLSLRPFCRSDRLAVFQLLSGLPLLYPKSHIWLDKRLDDVLLGKAQCTLAQVGTIPVGLTIETPKGAQSVKLSTIFVDPKFRNMQVGSLLLGGCLRRWMLNEVSRAHVTVDARRSQYLLPFFSRFAFDLISTEHNRYGTDRDEHILVWKHSEFVDYSSRQSLNGIFRNSS
jgi:hypothetical protein